MGLKGSNESTWISVQVSKAEKAVLDRAAQLAAKTRNRFIRDWIASLRDRTDEAHPEQSRDFD